MDKIIVKDLIVRFKKEVVLDVDCLNIKQGECTGFVGRNGCGKSLLFKTICGFVKYSGIISVDGKIIGKDCDFIQNAGVIIEQPNFIGYISPFENLKVLAQINKKINDDKIISTMEVVGLDYKNKKRTSKLSLGMKQRLRIAQALMEDPDILILDEPFNGLDEDGVT